MDKYVNEDTIIKNETFESFQELIICPICECIMIEPVMCLNCQNNYCKKCIEDWKKKSTSCPNRCENPIYKNVIGKNRLISKFKFKCIKGCGEEILFDDIQKHYSSNCLENKLKNSNMDINKEKEKEKQKEKEKEKEPTIRILSGKEVAEYKKKNGGEIEYFTSKYKR